MDNTKVADKIASLQQYQLDRLAKLWSWEMTVEQISKRTGHSPRVVKGYLQKVGLWEDRRKGAEKRATTSH